MRPWDWNEAVGLAGYMTMMIMTCLCPFSVYVCDMQLHAEYETDQQQALDRIAAEVAQSIMNMRNSIEHAHECRRDELIQRLEAEQKDRLAAVKRLQWVSFILLLIV